VVFILGGLGIGSQKVFILKWFIGVVALAIVEILTTKVQSGGFPEE
jgi:hypothetical protein